MKFKLFIASDNDINTQSRCIILRVVPVYVGQRQVAADQ